MGLRALLPGIRPADLSATLGAPLPGPTLDLASPWAPSPNHLQSVVLSDIFGADALANLPLSRAQAMAVPAVARARHIIAGTVARIPLRAYRADTALGRFDEPRWINSTGSALPPYHRMLWTADDLLFHGWSCWSRTNGTDDKPVRMDRIPMGRWSIDDAGRVKVDRGDGTHVLVDQATVALIPGPHEGLLVFAQSAIRHARDLQVAVGQAASTPAAHLVIKQVAGEPLLPDNPDPNKASINGLLDQWAAARKGKRGGVGYLPQGLEVEELGSFQSHLLESGRNAATVDIARAASLPADLLDAAGESSLTYANSRDNDVRAIQYGVGLYLSAISAALSQDAICPRGQRVEFDLEKWLQSPVPAAASQPAAPQPAATRPTLEETPRVTSLSLAGGQLLTAAADTAADDRVRSGILVPWGEPGRTNLGIKRVHRGALTLTADAKIVGIYGHNREAAVSRVISTEDRPEGLFGRIRIARTALGDQLLAEIDDGARDALSIEFSDLEFDAAGDVTAARLDFVAHVPVGAYDSARIDLAATVHDSTGEPNVTQPDTLAAAPADEMAALRAEMSELRAALPSAAAVLSTAGLPTPAASGTSKLEQLATLQAAVATEGATPEMKAALADITNTDLSLFHRPAGIGEELWSGGGYTRRFVPLFTQKELTSWKFGGWRWAQGPEVDDYAGDKTEIPTNEVSVTPVEGTAQRVAGGWDIDRKFRDFGDAAFWTGFYAAQAESYAEKTDQIAAAALVAAAVDITVDANVPTEYAGVNVAQADILRATALGQAILEDTSNVRRPADWVLMNSADWLGLMDLTNLDLPAFLSMLGVQPGAFLRSPLVPSGKVILGVRPSISFYELGGGAPIRVEALDVARAGIDSAVYGYCGTLVNRPKGVISVPLVVA